MKCPPGHIRNSKLRSDLGGEGLDDSLWEAHMHKLYSTWQHVKGRCYNANDKRFPRYGGRGIRMTAAWRMNFARFATDMGLPPEPTGDWSIERQDTDGNYEPSNCVWANAKEQANNRSTSHLLTWDDMVHTISEWSELTGIPGNVIQRRVSDGWPIASVLTVPVLPATIAKRRHAAAERRRSAS